AIPAFSQSAEAFVLPRPFLKYFFVAMTKKYDEKIKAAKVVHLGLKPRCLLYLAIRQLKLTVIDKSAGNNEISHIRSR
ncbi:MAG: hypothetical protein R6U11_08125, partial [Bacteroidales bacterium]